MAPRTASVQPSRTRRPVLKPEARAERQANNVLVHGSNCYPDKSAGQAANKEDQRRKSLGNEPTAILASGAPGVPIPVTHEFRCPPETANERQ